MACSVLLCMQLCRDKQRPGPCWSTVTKRDNLGGVLCGILYESQHVSCEVWS
jgi:hypothetical protein